MRVKTWKNSIPVFQVPLYIDAPCPSVDKEPPQVYSKHSSATDMEVCVVLVWEDHILNTSMSVLGWETDHQPKLSSQ